MSEDVISSTPAGVAANAATPAPAPLPVQAIHFCGVCGAAWQQAWLQCENCVARAARRASGTELTFSEEKRSITMAVALYGSLLAISIIAMIVVSASHHRLKLQGLIVEDVIFSTIVLLWAASSYRTLVPVLTRVGPIRWILAAPFLAVVTFLVATLAVSKMHQWMGIAEIRYLDIFTQAGYGLGLATLSIAVQPAIFEELAFRGVIFDSLRRVTGSTEAILVSAAMFAILHLSIPSFTHLLLMGVVLAWLRHKTGSLYAGIVLHFTHNFLCLLSEHLGGLLPW